MSHSAVTDGLINRVQVDFSSKVASIIRERKTFQNEKSYRHRFDDQMLKLLECRKEHLAYTRNPSVCVCVCVFSTGNIPTEWLRINRGPTEKSSQRERETKCREKGEEREEVKGTGR